MNKIKKIFVSCGEMSGDLHLSYLIKEIKKIDSSNKLIYLNNLKLLFNQITGVTDTK